MESDPFMKRNNTNAREDTLMSFSTEIKLVNKALGLSHAFEITNICFANGCIESYCKFGTIYLHQRMRKSF